jgi:hypothetical protein
MSKNMNFYLYQKALLRMDGDYMCKTLNKLNKMSAETILLKTGQLNQVPVNLDVILDNLKIKKVGTSFDYLEQSEEFKNLGEISGLVLLDGNDVGIFYKETDSLHRRRFTVAHELGHCCLHGNSLQDGYIEFRNNSNNGSVKEIEANTFAGELLIPKHSLNNIINRLMKPSIKALAEIFEVSISVMRGRLEVLKIPYYDDILDKIIVPE